MRQQQTRLKETLKKSIACATLLCMLGSQTAAVLAATTDIATSPLASTTTAQVKPNIMYLMDTSGSMAWGHMPDAENSYVSSTGYKNNLCNSMYYNPNTSYLLPKQASGSDYAAPSFTSASSDGFLAGGNVNLSTSFRAYTTTTGNTGSNDTSQAAYYYSYSGPSYLNWTGAPCTQTPGTSPFSAAGQSAPGSATDPDAPFTPTSVTITAVGSVGGSVYAVADAGNYKYQVTAFNNIGESAPTAISGAVAIAANGGAQLVITDGGSTRAPATGYRIYRTAVGGSTTSFVLAVQRATTTGSIAAATTTVTEMNNPGTWTKVLVSATSSPTAGDERQNFANWYTYYRTRLQMMKAAATRAFIQLSDSYRVGFVTISPGSPVTSTYFLGISDFTTAQRTAWFSKMTSQSVNASTPLREALSRVGRYYAGKADGLNAGMGTNDGSGNLTSATDPIQYSCQQNFTVLTTDGYWNGNGGQKLDSSSLTDSWDSNLTTTPLPLWDSGGDGSQISVDKSNAWQYTACTPKQQRTTQITKRTSQTQQSTAQMRQSTQQDLETTFKVEQSTSQTVSTQTIQTGGIYNIIITDVANGASSLSNVVINGSNRLTAPIVNTGPGGTTSAANTSRRQAVAAWIAGHLSAGYEAIAFGQCSSSTNNSPVTGCDRNNANGSVATHYVQIMAPAQNIAATPSFGSGGGAPTGMSIAAAGLTNPGSITNTSGNVGTAPGTCSVGIVYNTATNTKTNTTACPGPVVTGPTLVASCTNQAPGAGNSWTTTSCTTTTFINNQPAASCTPVSGAVNPQRTCATNNTTNVPVASCTAAPKSAGNSFTLVTCSPNNTGPTFVNRTTCPASIAPSAGNSWVTTTCALSADTGYVVASSCSAGFSSPTTTECITTDTGFVEVDSCSASSSGGQTITCQNGTSNSGQKIQYKPTTVTTTSILSGGSVVGTPTTTSSTAGSWSNLDNVCYAARALPSLPASGRPTGTLPPLPTSPCTAWPCVTTTSGQTGGATGTLADVAAYYYQNDLRSSMADNVPANGSGTEDDKATWQHMTTFTMGLGLSGTLTFRSDYKTATTGDFSQVRDGSKSWPVPNSDDPTALDDLWHAAVNGRGQFFSAADPDSVVDGLVTALAGINARVSSAAAAATSNLEPVAGDNFAYTAKYVTTKWVGELEAHAIDLNTGSVLSGTGTALPSVTGASNASPIVIVTSSAHGIATGDHVSIAGAAGNTAANGSWTVTVVDSTSFSLNTSTGNGAYSGGATATKLEIVWTAQAQLDAKTKNACDNRNIYLFRSGATNNLVNFTYNTYACDSAGSPTGTAGTGLNATEQANFSSTQVALLSQYPSMTTGSSGTTDQRTPAAGANLVNFLRGQRGFEGFTTNDATKLYRTREHVLGDIVNAQPVYVKTPFASYTDSGYTAFKSANTNRAAQVYVAANDGMLHAFSGDTGAEQWAFIPSIVLPNLYKLADDNYANTHQYFVDGTPTVGDFYDTVTVPGTPTWKTLLVAGLNAGGKGYYALDITDPATPKAMWEFKYSSTCYDETNAVTKAATNSADCHIGLTYNNPVVSKLSDGTWVVFVTSGYNNDDGIGYLYVLNAATGKIIYRISTGVGTAATPSGLNHINNWVENTLADNTTTRVYGADILGNVWRFDVNDSILPAGREATLIGTTKDSGATAQPITTRPELAEVSGAPYVFVSTGRLLGNTDLTNTQVQSIYGIKDPLGASTAYTNLRTSLKNMTLTQVGSGSTATRTVACSGSTTNCASTDGWVMDLPESGERVNVDMKLQLGTLVVASNVPESDACSIGGHSWLNFFNYATGTAVANSSGGAVGKYLSASLAVGLNIVRLPSGKTVVITTTSDAKQTTVGAPFDVPGPAGKRISWREIVQ